MAIPIMLWQPSNKRTRTDTNDAETIARTRTEQSGARVQAP